MGNLAQCEASGIPGNLLIPVIPPTAGWSKRGGSNPNGKAPGRFVRETGRWDGLDNWPHGCPVNERRISDDWLCNAGLILGQEVEGRMFAVLDGDLSDDGEGVNAKLRPVLLGRLIAAFGGAGFQVRETVHPRFMILVELDPAGDYGGRERIEWTYHRADGQKLSLGKFELLTRGEQAVIAGTHISGNTIHWWHTSKPKDEYLAPRVNDGIPKFAHWGALRTAVLDALKPFELGNIFTTVKEVPTSALVGASRDPIDLTPPDTHSFVELVDRMQNRPDIDYSQYVNFWYALEGCRRSLEILGRSTPEDDHEIVRAGLDWAGRWKPPNAKDGKSRSAEMDMWLYVKQVPNISLGWGYMKLLATQCGVKDISTEEAQREFVADLEPLPPARLLTRWTNPDPDKRMPVTSGEFEATGNNPKGLIPGFRSVKRRVEHGLHVPLSDVQIADHMEMEMSGKFVWLSDEKRWLTYEGARGWRGDDASGSRVEVEIEEALRDYVARWADAAAGDGERWTKSERAGALSTHRINAVMQRLAPRFAKSRGDTDKGKFILQTPEGALDLRTGLAVDVAVQKAFIDTRCTNFGVEPGLTPLFDELLFNLSDGDPTVFSYLLHFLGYSLMGSPRNRVFVFIWGTTGNGKSALVRILSRIFGNYVVTLNKDVLLQRGREMHKTDLYRIRGARIACAVEMPPNEKWDEALLKAITGGDEISARPMRMDARSFEVEATLLMVGNSIPAFDRIDQAIAARARITGTTFQPAVPDPTWEDRMVATEAPAIVAKLCGYAKAVFDADMKLPEVPGPMARATRVYLGEQDKFYAWVTAELLVGFEHRERELPFTEMKKRFEAFIRRDGEGEDGFTTDKMTDRTFIGHLRVIGLKLESDSSGVRLQRVTTIDGKKDTEFLVRGCTFRLRAVAVS